MVEPDNDPNKNQSVTPTSTDQSPTAPSTPPGPGDKPPGTDVVDPMFYDPKNVDPALRPIADQIEKRMQATFTKKSQALAGETRLLEQVKAAMGSKQVAKMFAEELYRGHGMELPEPGTPSNGGGNGSPEQPSEMPEEAFRTREEFDRHLGQQIEQRAEKLMADQVGSLRGELSQSHDQIQKLETLILSKDRPLMRQYEAEIQDVRRRHPTLSLDQAYDLATKDAQQQIAQRRFQEESNQRVAEVENSFTESGLSTGPTDEPIEVKKGEDLYDVFRKVVAKSRVQA